MTQTHDDIAAQIDRAYDLAAQGSHVAAAQAFALARTMCTELCEPSEIRRLQRGHTAVLTKERAEYRRVIAKERDGDRTLVVLGDSLGLPRPEEKSGPLNGAAGTYPVLAMDHLDGYQVDSICQRYFTTDHIVELLEAEPDLGAEADVVFHVGLNDCANRMFQERDRLALNLLPEATKDRIVSFAQRYRRQLIRRLPSYHYVDPVRFRSNLDTALSILRARRARRVVLATIILPPVRFWNATPGLQRNFGRYNQIIMDVAAHHDAHLFDLDRHIWARQHEGVLLPDGMHLSLAGHRLFAEELAKLLS